MIKELKPHDRTRRIMVGDVPVGGGAPVAVQSMLNVAADDVAANLAQIEALAEAGCEIVRMAIPRRDCLDAFEAVCAASPLPVVADIHFDARIAIEAAARDDLTLPEKLAASATEYVRFFEDECDFHDIVVSAKAHDVQTTIDTYRLLAAELPQVPLHIGVTEAGTAFQGIIKSASGLGVLLEEGIGDTMRISLTDDPVVEVRACWTLLGALDLRRRTPELISCPTCGRCQVNLIGLAQEVEERLATVDKPVKVAVMGCVVNGPGEAADADIGVACGAGAGVVFSHGKIVRKVQESEIVSALMEELENL